MKSKKPRKQRKARFEAPLHLRHVLISSNLSKELRKKYNRRSFPLRKGDDVKIMRGGFKNKKGKIALINLQKMKIYVEGIQKTKKDGTKISIPLEPSNLQIIGLNLEDKQRVAALEKKLGGKNAS